MMLQARLWEVETEGIELLLELEDDEMERVVVDAVEEASAALLELDVVVVVIEVV